MQHQILLQRGRDRRVYDEEHTNRILNEKALKDNHNLKGSEEENYKSTNWKNEYNNTASEKP